MRASVLWAAIFAALPLSAQIPLCMPPLVWAYVLGPQQGPPPYVVGFVCTNLGAIPALIAVGCPTSIVLPTQAMPIALYLSAAGVRVANPPDAGYPWEFAVANVTEGAPQPVSGRWTGVPLGPTVQVTGSGCPNVMQVVQSPTQVTVICN